MLFVNLAALPAGVRMTSWYFGGTAFVLFAALVLAVWAFHTSLGGRKLWKEDFLG
jgi:hypothetical protein